MVNQIKLAVRSGVVGIMNSTNPLSAARVSNTAKGRFAFICIHCGGWYFLWFRLRKV